MKNKKLSIKAISELAGVSVATVSRVINKNGRYSAETERKILDIIEKYQYKPNLIAKGLRTNNSLCIGIIVPDIINEFFAKIVREIESMFFQKGYTVFVCNTDEKADVEEKYYNDLIAKGVVGIIYISGKTNRTSNLFNIPTVYIDRNPGDQENSIVIESDNFQGGYLATKELIINSCKQILLIRDCRTISTQENRYKGYQKALMESNIDINDSYIIKVDKVGYDSSKEAVKELLNKGMKFDGVFATTDWMALGAIDGIKEANLTVPEDIKVVGFDNVSISKFSSVPITTINLDINKMAEMAVTFILNMINGKPVSINKYITPVEIIRRNSV